MLMAHVVQVRETGGQFSDLFDFLERIDSNLQAAMAISKAA